MGVIGLRYVFYAVVTDLVNVFYVVVTDLVNFCPSVVVIDLVNNFSLFEEVIDCENVVCVVVTDLVNVFSVVVTDFCLFVAKIDPAIDFFFYVVVIDLKNV